MSAIQRRLALLAAAVLVVVLLVVWFGMDQHTAHQLLRALRHAL